MSDFILQHLYKITDYILAGGIVMLPLVAVCILMWSLIIERVLFFSRAKDKLKLMITEEFLKRKTGRKDIDYSLLKEIKTASLRMLNAHINIIKILAIIAPLLGLLGTVTGMIKTFEVISSFGTGNVRLMASGISEALITTQTGLVIAIPGIYMSKLLEERSQRLSQRIDLVIMRIKKSYLDQKDD